MPAVLFSRLARRDLSAIGSLIGQGSPAAARSYVADIEAHSQLFSTYPSMGTAHDEAGAGVRLLPFRKRANILYRIGRSEMLILRVLYAGHQG